MDRIPDEAVVIRGGRNRPEDFERGTGIYPIGVTGVSVECGLDASAAELSAALPHRQIGVSTVGTIREAGGDVVRTARSLHHATLVGLAPDAASSLFTPTVPNPNKQ